eukprot:575598-Rhodomonas_salina.3
MPLGHPPPPPPPPVRHIPCFSTPGTGHRIAYSISVPDTAQPSLSQYQTSRTLSLSTGHSIACPVSVPDIALGTRSGTTSPFKPGTAICDVSTGQCVARA